MHQSIQDSFKAIFKNVKVALSFPEFIIKVWIFCIARLLVYTGEVLAISLANQCVEETRPRSIRWLDPYYSLGSL